MMDLDLRKGEEGKNMSERSELKQGNIIGIIDDRHDVTPVPVQTREVFDFVELGKRADVVWVDAGDYTTVIYPDSSVQLSFKEMKKLIAERIRLFKVNQGGRHHEDNIFYRKDIKGIVQLPLGGME